MGRYKGVLLDVGNTLWGYDKTPAQVWHQFLTDLGADALQGHVGDALEDVYRALQPRWQAFETSGVPTDPEAIDRSFDGLNAAILEELGVAADLNAVGPEIRARFHGSTQLYPDSLEVLTRLSGSYRLAVVSNGVYQAETSRSLGIEHYFDTIIGSWHVGFRKPMPEIFHLALSVLDVCPEEAVMVGDLWDKDVVGGEGVGIKSLHIVRDGQDSPSPDAITDLWGLVRFLESNGS